MRTSLVVLYLFFFTTISAFAQTAEEYVEKGYKYAYDGNYYLALKNYDKAINLDPKLAKAYYNRGNVKYDLKDYEGAIEDCEKAIALNPNLIDAYFNVAISKYHLKDFDGAIKYFDQAIRINDKDGESYYWRGMSNFKNGKTNEACKDWNMAKTLGNSFVNEFIHKYCEEENGVETGDGMK
jgi:tetratricopeptide (TPR) repeat protein